MKKLSGILLGVWLVLKGLIALTEFNFRSSSQILSILAIVTGILFLLSDRSDKITERAPDLVLGIWLVLVGLIPLLQLRFRGSHVVLEVLAIAAGVLVLIRR